MHPTVGIAVRTGQKVIVSPRGDNTKKQVAMCSMQIIIQ